MSAEDAVTEALGQPVNQNAQAAEDAKNLLAELQAEEATSGSPAANPTSDGVELAKPEPATSKNDVGERSADETKKDNTAQEDKEIPKHHEMAGSSHGGERRGGRGGKFKNYKENIKSDLTSQETSSDPGAIRKQVEFYFSDSNLPMDKFLLGKVGGSQNDPVEISIIHSFKRMRRFQPFEAIVEALKDSQTLQLTDDNTKVQRKAPLPAELDNVTDDGALKVFEDKAMPRSVYVKGFGQEVPSTQFDIEAFFAEYGPTNAIRLRRTEEKVFKGSVFVEFENEDLAKKFLELDPKPQYHGKDLNIMSKKAYCDQKVEDIKAGKIRRNDRPYNNRSSRGARGGGRDKRKRDDEDDRDWRERRDNDRKNGFRDDRRRGHRDQRPEGRNRNGAYQRGEKDERGVPVVKTTTETERKAMKDEAIAKARAAVDAENNKKRDREDDTAHEEPAAKKVDTKEETS